MVAIPYGGTPHPEHLERAVKSVLAQTVTLRCVVLCDGIEPPALPADDRLVVHQMPEAHGCYFARQVLLDASPYEWHAPVDSDDWIDPTHLEVMFDHLDGTQAAVPRRLRGWVDGRGPREYGKGRFHVGLIGTDRMRAFGGYAPHEVVASDSLMLMLLKITGEVRSVTEPVTYNRVQREGSLTRDPATGHRSEVRKATAKRNWATLHQAQRLRTARRIREYRETLIPQDVKAALLLEAAALRHALMATGGPMTGPGPLIVGESPDQSRS